VSKSRVLGAEAKKYLNFERSDNLARGEEITLPLFIMKITQE